MRKLVCITAVALALVGLSSDPSIAAPPPGMLHIRGAIASVKPTGLTVITATGTIAVTLPPHIGVTALIPSSASDVKPGSFLGIASDETPTGTYIAREVVVFPESARGAGEGNYAWDLPAKPGVHSRMTNGTVKASTTHSKMTNGTVKVSSSGGVTLTYKSGTGMDSQAISLPPSVPYVTFVSGSQDQLTVGTHVFIAAHKSPGGAVTADRVLYGKNGLVPPM